jgi:hypothetical protein
MRACLLLPIATLLLVGCSTAPTTPVPVRGTPADVAALAGEWDGVYESDDGTRRGVIDFHLQAGRDTAYGDVLLTPRAWVGAPPQNERMRTAPTDAIASRWVGIRWVRIANGYVTGRMEPRVDPSCGYTLSTTFRGRLVGDTLRGDYASTYDCGGPPILGTWWAARKPPKP